MRSKSRRRVVAACAVALAVVLLAACQSGAGQAIDRSRVPVLVPQGQWKAKFDFTAPPGSTDLYQFRWNFSPGATEVVVGWQIATAGPARNFVSEGSDDELVGQVLRAAAGEGCELVGQAVTMQLCLYPAEFSRDGVNAYLVRPLPDKILVVDYINIDGRRIDFNADALEARFIAAEFEAVPIQTAVDRYGQ